MISFQAGNHWMCNCDGDSWLVAASAFGFYVIEELLCWHVWLTERFDPLAWLRARQGDAELEPLQAGHHGMAGAGPLHHRVGPLAQLRLLHWHAGLVGRDGRRHSLAQRHLAARRLLLRVVGRRARVWQRLARPGRRAHGGLQHARAGLGAELQHQQGEVRVRCQVYQSTKLRESFHGFRETTTLSPNIAKFQWQFRLRLTWEYAVISEECKDSWSKCEIVAAVTPAGIRAGWEECPNPPEYE